MTDDKAQVCAICACDKFFLMCRKDSCLCDLVCTGCGVRTTVSIGNDGQDTLVGAP